MASKGRCLPTIHNVMEVIHLTMSRLAVSRKQFLAKTFRTSLALIALILKRLPVAQESDSHFLCLIVAKIEFDCTDAIFKYFTMLLINIFRHVILSFKLIKIPLLTNTLQLLLFVMLLFKDGLAISHDGVIRIESREVRRRLSR